MAWKILDFFVCLIIILQIVTSGANTSPAASGSTALFGAFTTACACVDNIVVSASSLGEQFNRAPHPKPPRDAFLVTTEIRRADKQVFRPLSLPGLSPFSLACLNLRASTNKNTCGPPGRASPPVMYLLIFAIILALSNLPAPVSCFVRFALPGLQLKPGFLFDRKKRLYTGGAL